MKKELIKQDDINSLLVKSVSLLSDELKVIWNEIKITPTKWKEITSSREFWAIAIIDGEVIWYNDLEDGFNISKYKTDGEIGEYWNDQCPLNDLLWHLF